MNIYFCSKENIFPRIVVSDDLHLKNEKIQEYAEVAIEIADKTGFPVHIQSINEITHLVIYPE